MASSAIKTPAFLAKAGNITNEDGSSIYSNGDWSLKNSTAVASVTISDAGNVGIGTSSPTSPLTIDKNYSFGARNVAIELRDVSGTTGRTYFSPVENQFFLSTGGYYYGGGQYQLEDGKTGMSSLVVYEGEFRFFSASGQTANSLVSPTERMRIAADGAVTIGSDTALSDSKLRAGKATPIFMWRNSSAGSALVVEKSDSLSGGDVFVAFSSSAADIGGGSVGGGIRRNSGNTAFEFYNQSDERLKDVKGEFDGAAEMVKGIPVKWYAWKTDPSKEHFRFIAQDVQKHIPSAVSEDENGHLMLGESDMFPVLWQAVREQQAIIEELKAKVSALEAK